MRNLIIEHASNGDCGEAFPARDADEGEMATAAVLIQKALS